MAVAHRGIIGYCWRYETTDERRKFPFQVGTDEAQEVTVLKPGETSFETAGDTNSTAAKATAAYYILTVDNDDLDAGPGVYLFLCEGSTDDQYVKVVVTEYNPLKTGALSDRELMYRAATPG